MNDIKKFEMMAKLRLTEDERSWISACAERLIDGFNLLSSVSTEGIEPLVSVLEGSRNNFFRDDIPVKMISRDELFINAPSSHDGYFVAPKTV